MKIDIDDFKSWHKDKIKETNEAYIELDNRFPYLQKSILKDEDEIPSFYKLLKYIDEKKIRDPKGRYLIFSYENYYPDGGINDLVVRTNDLDNFIEAFHATDGKPNCNITCFDMEIDTTFDLKERINYATHNTE